MLSISTYLLLQIVYIKEKSNNYVGKFTLRNRTTGVEAEYDLSPMLTSGSYVH